MPVAGTIALNAFQKGNHVVIEVEDDGRGIDEATLVERAVAMGKVERSDVGELGRPIADGRELDERGFVLSGAELGHLAEIGTRST